MERTENTTAKKSLSTSQMTVIGLMTAITCILGPLSLPIPISPVPISLTNLVIYIMLYVLGTKNSLISCVLYILIGLVGLPVFSGFAGGPAKLVGPTGGYLVGFLFIILISGPFIDKFPKKRALHVLGMVLGMAVCYAFGTAWLAKQLEIGFVAALGVGVIPYLPGDAIKIAVAVLAGPALKRSVLQGLGR